MKNKKEISLKYTLRCIICQNVEFGAIPDGQIYCIECGSIYGHSKDLYDWTPVILNTDDVMSLEHDKLWDEDSKTYRPRKDVIKKYLNKKQNKKDDKNGI